MKLLLFENLSKFSLPINNLEIAELHQRLKLRHLSPPKFFLMLHVILTDII
jgi:hypothetical protein